MEDTGLSSKETERNTGQDDTILHAGAPEDAYIIKSPNTAHSVRSFWAVENHPYPCEESGDD